MNHLEKYLMFLMLFFIATRVSKLNNENKYTFLLHLGISTGIYAVLDYFDLWVKLY